MFGRNSKVTKTSRKRLPAHITALLVTLVFAAVYFYVALPAVNLQNPGFYFFWLSASSSSVLCRF